MLEHRFAVLTAVGAFSLLVIGGLVHPTGSSLACADWPLCNGELLPPMRGGVLFEHGHRIVALVVATLTAVLAALVVKRRTDAALRRLAVAAVVLVAGQAALGAVVVLFALPVVASTAHLALSMAFLAVVIVLAARLRGPAAARGAALPRALPAAAAAATYVSVVLGGLVRHAGASLACDGAVLCGGALWPADAAARLHMAHRLWNWGLAVLVVAAAWQVLRAPAAPRAARALAATAPPLLVAQGLLGILTVGTGVSVPVVSLHLALAALVLADLVALVVALRPRAPAAGELAPTAG